MRQSAFYVGLVLLCIFLQMTLIPRILVSSMQPDLAFLVVLYLGLHRSSGTSTVTVVISGYLADLFSGLPSGTFLLIYLVCFYVVGIFRRVLYSRGILFSIVLCGGLSLFYVLFLAILASLGSGERFLTQGLYFRGMIPFGLLNMLSVFPIFRLCRWLERYAGPQSSSPMRSMRHGLIR